jgi:hypothetical protein
MMPPRATHTALAFLRSDGSSEHIRQVPCDARDEDVTAEPNKLLRESGEGG